MFGKVLSRFVFLLVLTVSVNAGAAATEVSISAIEKTVQSAMKTFDVPGVAVAIVKDDKVVLAKGFGVRRLGGSDKVNADTLFGIASNTKAFTTAALAILVDEGKLNWDDLVVDYLPEFQLYDPYVTRHFTIRDMLSHRGGLGLGAGDLMIWPASNMGNDEIIQRLKYIKPASSFRSKYAYNNLMFVMAGELVAKVSGMPWADFVRSRIIKPLHMDHTRMMYSLIDKNDHNVASPHAPVEGKLMPVGGDFLQNFLSAGSIASSVNDMSKWIKAQLHGGLIGQRNGQEVRLFTQDRSDEMWLPNIMRKVGSFDREHFGTHFRGYAMGWGVNDHRGYRIVSHTGGILGMVSRVALVPELNLGMVVLTNQQSGSAFMAITTDIIDRYIGAKPQDWVSIYHERSQKGIESAQQKLKALMDARNVDSKPSLPLKAYAQTYRDDWYGDISIRRVVDKKKGERLEIRFSRTKALVGTLEHFQYNTFIVRWNDRSLDADAFINFQLDAEGKVESATMKAVSELTDFSFDFQDLLLKPKL